MFAKYLKNKGGILNLLHRIKSHVPSKRKKQFIVLFILMILLSFTEAVSLASIVPFIGIFLNPDIFYSDSRLSFFINFFDIKNSDQLFLFVTLVFLSLVIISATIKLTFVYISNKVSSFTESDLRSTIFKYNINQTFSYHLEQNSNIVMSNLLQKTSAIQIYIRGFLEIIAALLIITFVLTILLLIKPLIILSIASIVISFFVVIAFVNKKKILRNSKNMSEGQDKIVNIFQDSIGYIGETILYSLHNIFILKFDKYSYQIANSMASNKNIQQSPRIYLEYVALICLVILIFFLNQSEYEISNSLTILAALGLGAQKILPLINNVHNSLSSMRAQQIVMSDALNLLDRSKQEDDINFNNEKIFLKKSIKLNNVYFSYNEKKNWILKNINLEIKKGSKVGVKGTTGSGKSTLGNIIIGLLDPTKGELFIDDVLINLKNKKSWQKNISIIPQNIFLNDVSFAENIAIGVNPDEINLEKVKESAKKARIDHFIESKPNKYNEKVGERGVKLSGGQRQRIGIARALYREARVILFDEATNQLDNETEALVMESINNLDKEITIIFIAHRLSTLENCDQIVDLSKI